MDMDGGIPAPKGTDIAEEGDGAGIAGVADEEKGSPPVRLAKGSKSPFGGTPLGLLCTDPVLIFGAPGLPNKFGLWLVPIRGWRCLVPRTATRYFLEPGSR